MLWTPAVMLQGGCGEVHFKRKRDKKEYKGSLGHWKTVKGSKTFLRVTSLACVSFPFQDVVLKRAIFNA